MSGTGTPESGGMSFNELMGWTGTDKEISVRVRSDLHNIIKEMESVVMDYKTDEEVVDNG